MPSIPALRVAHAVLGASALIVPLLALAGCRGKAAPPPAAVVTGKPVAIQPLRGKGDLPADAAPLVDQGLAAVQAKDLRTVSQVVTALAPRAASSADLAERLATICRAAGQVDLAWKFARLAVSVAPDSPSALLVLSVAETDLDWIAAVPERLKQIKKLAPFSVEPRLALATNLQAADQLKAAETEYRELIAMDPDNPAGYGMLANNLYMQERYDDARAANVEAAKRGGPGNPAVWVLGARIDLDQAEADPKADPNRRKDALAALEAGCAHQPVPAALFLLGTAREADGDLKGARKAFEAAYTLMPDYPRLRPRLGRLRIRLKDVRGGEQLLAEERKAAEGRDALRRLVNVSGADLKDPELHRAVAKEADKRRMVARARLEWQLVALLAPGDTEAKNRLAALMPGVPDVPMPATFP
ncbi:MAG: hypothetical protein ACKO5K_10290 [Armatimonadota bacterium]